MRNLAKATGLAAGALLVFAGLASARNNARMYDPATETTLKGTVQAVTQTTRGAMMGTHLTVKTPEETREVMLGPAGFLSKNGFAFAAGDAVEVTGSRITMGAMEFVIAREVLKDGKTLTLRDKSGIPQWAGRGAGRRRGR